MKKEDFIRKAVAKHGNKYDYSKVNNCNKLSYVEIICPEHGSFWQAAGIHLRGCGCPLCANTRRGKKTATTENLIERFKEVHGDTYDYTKTVYNRATEKVIITCPKHGDFEQLPFTHLQGQGCPKCKGRGWTREDYIAEFRKTHGDKYNYDKAEITKAKSKITITCPIHGDFEQTPSKHIKGQGCPKCGIDRRAALCVTSFDEFVERANEVHNYQYTYDGTGFKKLHSKINITCPKHGVYRQLAYDHLNGHACPACSVNKSSNESEIYQFIKNILGEENIETRNRKILNGKELDIYIPSLNIAIEYNGCIWHSEKFGKNKKYHLDKTIECERNNIKLIQIFEDEYINHKDIVLSKIEHILGVSSKPRIIARKCVVKNISKKEAQVFLERNHIQGYGGAKVHVGCFWENNLVGVMSFKEDSPYHWNLIRFATDIDYNCIGIGGKLLSFFINSDYKIDTIKTFADRRWTSNPNNNLYTRLGFTFKQTLPPDYRYITSTDPTRRHKFNFRKQLLYKRYNMDLNLTESEMCDKLGFYKIWDCGLFCYEMVLKEKDEPL